MNNSIFLFVVDTDTFAGNFERNMCAFMTGQADEFASAHDEQAQYHEDTDGQEDILGDLVTTEVVGTNTFFLAPCDIWPNPNWYNNGLGAHVRYDDPDGEQKALRLYIEQVRKDNDKAVRNYSANNWSANAMSDALARDAEKLAKAEALTTPHKYLAYLSVAIFLETRPTQVQIDFMKDRARKYLDKYCPDVTLEGFRLLEKITSYVTEAL